MADSSWVMADGKFGHVFSGTLWLFVLRLNPSLSLFLIRYPYPTRQGGSFFRPLES